MVTENLARTSSDDARIDHIGAAHLGHSSKGAGIEFPRLFFSVHWDHYFVVPAIAFTIKR